MTQNLQNHTDVWEEAEENRGGHRDGRTDRQTLIKDTDSINSRDLEVINELDDCFSVGVRRVTVPHLQTHARTHAHS